MIHVWVEISSWWCFFLSAETKTLLLPARKFQCLMNRYNVFNYTFGVNPLESQPISSSIWKFTFENIKFYPFCNNISYFDRFQFLLRIRPTLHFSTRHVFFAENARGGKRDGELAGKTTKCEMYDDRNKGMSVIDVTCCVCWALAELIAW